MMTYSVRKLLVAITLSGVAVSGTAIAGPFSRKPAPAPVTAPAPVAAPIANQIPMDSTTPVDEQGRPVDPRKITTANGKPVIFLNEPGKPEQQGVIESSTPQPDGSIKHKVRMVKTGEILELTDAKGASTTKPTAPTVTSPAPVAVAPKPLSIEPAKPLPLAMPTVAPVVKSPTAYPSKTPDGLILPSMEPVAQPKALIRATPAVNTNTPAPVSVIPSTVNPERPSVTASYPRTPLGTTPTDASLPTAQPRSADPLMNMNRKLLSPAAEASEGRLFPKNAQPVPPKKPSFWQRLTGSSQTAAPVKPKVQPMTIPLSQAPTPSVPLSQLPGVAELVEPGVKLTEMPSDIGIARVKLDEPTIAPMASPVVQASSTTAPMASPIQPAVGRFPVRNDAEFEAGTVILPSGVMAVNVTVENISADQMLTQLREGDRPSQREQAIFGLLSLHATLPTDVIAAILKAAESDPAVTVRSTAIRSLAEKNVRTPAFVKLLKDRATDKDPVVSIEAKSALKAIGIR